MVEEVKLPELIAQLRHHAPLVALLGGQNGGARWNAAQLMREAADALEARPAPAFPDPKTVEACARSLDALVRHYQDRADSAGRHRNPKGEGEYTRRAEAIMRAQATIRALSQQDVSPPAQDPDPAG